MRPTPSAAEETAREVVPDVVGREPDMGDPPHAAARRRSRDPVVPTTRWLKRAPSKPPGNAVQAAISGPGSDHEAGAQHRLVPDAGQEEHGAQHHGAKTGEEQQRAGVGQGHGAVSDDGRLNDGIGMVAETVDQKPGGHNGQRRTHPGSGRWPSPSRIPARCLRQLSPPQGTSSPAPMRSAWCALGSRTSRNTRMPTTSASTLKGRLTRKTQRQLACTSRPPMGGPNAAAAPPTADHRPMAAPLRAGTEGGQQQPERSGQHERATAGLQHPGRNEQSE